MLSHCPWWDEAEIWHEDTLTCAVLGFARVKLAKSKGKNS